MSSRMDFLNNELELFLVIVDRTMEVAGCLLKRSSMVEVEEVLAYKPLSRKNIETASNLEIVAKNLALNFNLFLTFRIFFI